MRTKRKKFRGWGGGTSAATLAMLGLLVSQTSRIHKDYPAHIGIMYLVLLLTLGSVLLVTAVVIACVRVTGTAYARKHGKGVPRFVFLAPDDLRIDLSYPSPARGVWGGDHGTLLSGVEGIEFYGHSPRALISILAGPTIIDVRVLSTLLRWPRLRIESPSFGSGSLDLEIRSLWSLGLLPVLNSTARELAGNIMRDVGADSPHSSDDQ